MMLLLTILSWVFVAALAIVIFALVTPLRVRLRLATVPQFWFRCDLQGLGGLTPQITVFDNRASSKKNDQIPRSPTRTKLLEKKSAPKGSRMITALPSLMHDIIRQIRFETLKVNCEFGFPDPADTGRLSGIALALTHGIPVSRQMSISVVPNFQHPCFEADITAVIRLTIAAILIPVLRFAWRAFGLVR